MGHTASVIVQPDDLSGSVVPESPGSSRTGDIDSGDLTLAQQKTMVHFVNGVIPHHLAGRVDLR